MERIKLNIQRFADDEVEVAFQVNSEDIEKGLKQVTKGLNAVTSSLKETCSNVYKVGKAFSTWKIPALTNLTRQFSSLGKSLYKDFLTKAIDVSEELNLFNVVFNNVEKNGKKTFSKLGKEAVQFQNNLNEAFGTNMKETMRYQGLFQAMGESAGLSDETSALMSKNMTKLAYDLASLYNTTETKAAESLRAGVYAGQTKPLRNYGIDVTQTSYKPLMEELGLEKSVSELTQAEKEILRYISTLKQAKNAMGDFANTIESPANQLKVLKQQFYEMQAAIGNLFVGAFARILPYVNGIIMVIKALARAIASFFGIEMKDYNTGLASYADDLDAYGDSLDEVGDSANGAGSAIKALKRQVLAFDQINNLTTPTPSSGSGSGGGGSLGEIDERLLAALEEYDNGMDKVRMKAVEIRDEIMKWLGFTKEINAETGEISFNYDITNKSIDTIAKEIATNLGLMLNYYTNQINWQELGATIALGLNTAFGFIDSFVQTYDWENFGTKIADMINKAIKDIDPETLGRTITDKLRIAILSLSGFIETFDFKEFGSKLAKTINSAIKNIPKDELTEGLNNLADGIGETLGELMKDLDWGEIIDDIIDVISGLDWDTKLMLLAPILASAIVNMLTSSLVTNMIGQGIINAITQGLAGKTAAGGTAAAASGSGTGAAATGGGLTAILSNLGYAAAAVEGVKANWDIGTTSKNFFDTLYSGEALDMKSVFGFEKPQNLMDWWKIINVAAYPIVGTGDLVKNDIITGKTVADMGSDLTTEEKIENSMKSIKATFDTAQENEDHPLHFLTEWSQNLVDFESKVYTTFENIKIFISDKWEETKKKVEDKINEIKEKIDTFWDDVKKKVEETWENIKKTISDKIEEIKTKFNEWKDDFSKKIDDIKKKFEDTWNDIKKGADNAWKKVKETWDEAKKWFEENIKNPIKEKFDNAWTDAKKGASDAWEGIKKTFKGIPEWFKTKFEDAWKKVKDVFSTGGKIFTGIKEGIESTFKTVVNGIIGGINTIIQKPFNAINNVIGKLKSISIAGTKPFENKLSYISIPQIPYMANGGMLSSGQLFVAREAGPEMVGRIGNRTTVANNDQIVAGIEKGVYNAVKNAIGADGIGSVQIDLHTDEGVVIDRINRVTRQTGVCPIEV